MGEMSKMPYDLKDKVVLITGGAIGIGACVIDILLDEQIKHVAFLDVLEKKGKGRETELNAKYGNDKVKFYKCDVTQEEQLFGAFQSVLDKYGYIDVVINNAGIMNDSKALYKKEIDINVTSLVTCTYKAIEVMRKDKNGRGGVVVNISSIAAMIQDHILPVYYATKSAVLQFSNCVGMPEYYSKTGVRVITMCFGKTDTALVDIKNLSNYDTSVNTDVETKVKSIPNQGPQSAARALVEACKHGESGSTWLSVEDKPVRDITDKVKKAYKILTDVLFE